MLDKVRPGYNPRYIIFVPSCPTGVFSLHFLYHSQNRKWEEIPIYPHVWEIF